MRGHRRGDRHRRLVLGNRHHDLARMQVQRRPAHARRAAVDVVAEDRPAHLRAMYAQLMRPPGQRLERKPGQSLVVPAKAGTHSPSVSDHRARWGYGSRVSLATLARPGRQRGAAHHLPRRHRRLAMRVRLHPPAARLVELAERNVDAAFLFAGRAFDHRPIGFADLALLEQLAEQRQRLAVAAEHQAAGGVLVEPVRQSRIARQAEAQRVEIILQAAAALRAAMHRKARRLVDHQH